VNIIQRFLYKHGYVKRAARGYAAAQMGRLYADWLLGGKEEPNEDIRKDLPTLRRRGVDLFNNNDWVKKFIKLCDKNIIGHEGMLLKAQVKDPTGELDVEANRKIEQAFWEWGRCPRYASVTGKQSFLDIQHLAVKTAAREGEAIVRMVPGFNNPFRFSLQLIPPALLPVELNNPQLKNGNKIIMGIEYDKWERPVRYYIKQAPGARGASVINGNYYTVLPATEIVHLFIEEFFNQSRGVPWLHTAMHRLHMLDSYEQSELTAARMAACQMGLLYTETGDQSPYTGDSKDADGNTIFEAEPGIFRELPKNMRMEPWKPEHPTSQFPTFVKMLMLAISSGGDVAYSSMTGDLEKVNYSSIRAGLLDERDAWRVLQQWFAAHFCDPIYEGWLKMALLTQELELPAEKFNKFNSAYWQGRGWDWVDPLKDINATKEALRSGLTTWTEEAAKRGKDIEEVFEEMAKDKKLMEKYGLQFTLDKGTAVKSAEESEEE
jgi:lambda family phage portal protein